MTIDGYDDSVFKHGIAREEIEYAKAQFPILTKLVGLGTSNNGNTTATFVGFTARGDLIEFCVEYLDGQDWYYHADIASKENRKKYNQVR